MTSHDLWFVDVESSLLHPARTHTIHLFAHKTPLKHARWDAREQNIKHVGRYDNDDGDDDDTKVMMLI